MSYYHTWFDLDTMHRALKLPDDHEIVRIAVEHDPITIRIVIRTDSGVERDLSYYGHETPIVPLNELLAQNAKEID